MVVSLETSPISMKYLHSWICTTAAKYQQIWEKISGTYGVEKDEYPPPQEGATW
jgi:hypothetical protein